MEQRTVPWTAFDYAVVDVEGNGQKPPDLVEISVVAIKHGCIGQANNWLVRPPRAITPISRRFHRITDDQLVDAPTVAGIEAELRRTLRDKVFVASTSASISAYSPASCRASSPRKFWTHSSSPAAASRPPRLHARSAVDAFGLATGLPADLMPHRATYDALVCARLLSHLATPHGREPLTVTELLDATAGRTTTGTGADESAATLF